MNWDWKLEPPEDEEAGLIAEAIDDLDDLRILDLAKDRLPATYERTIERLRESLKELFIYERQFPR